MCDVSWKNVCVKKLLHANTQARRAALVGNYFSRRSNFCLNGSWLPLFSCSANFDQIKWITFPSNFEVSYSVFICCFNMNGSEWGLKMQSEIHQSIHMVEFKNNICSR